MTKLRSEDPRADLAVQPLLSVETTAECWKFQMESSVLRENAVIAVSQGQICWYGEGGVLQARWRPLSVVRGMPGNCDGAYFWEMFWSRWWPACAAEAQSNALAH